MFTVYNHYKLYIPLIYAPLYYRYIYAFSVNIYVISSVIRSILLLLWYTIPVYRYIIPLKLMYSVDILLYSKRI